MHQYVYDSLRIHGCLDIKHMRECVIIRRTHIRVISDIKHAAFIRKHSGPREINLRTPGKGVECHSKSKHLALRHKQYSKADIPSCGFLPSLPSALPAPLRHRLRAQRYIDLVL